MTDMYKKMSAARRGAFLKSLAETGNQTLSAERAKVSRSWVCLQRSTDAGFDAACGEAIGAAHEALSPALLARPPLPPTASLRVPPSPAKGGGAEERLCTGPPARP